MLRGAKGLSVEDVYILGVCKDAPQVSVGTNIPGMPVRRSCRHVWSWPHLPYDGGLALVMARQIPSRRSVTRHDVG